MLASHGILNQSKGYELGIFFKKKLAKGYAFEYFNFLFVKMVMHSSKNSFIVSHVCVNFQIQGNL